MGSLKRVNHGARPDWLAEGQGLQVGAQAGGFHPGQVDGKLQLDLEAGPQPVAVVDPRVGRTAFLRARASLPAGFDCLTSHT